MKDKQSETCLNVSMFYKMLANHNGVIPLVYESNKEKSSVYKNPNGTRHEVMNPLRYMGITPLDFNKIADKITIEEFVRIWCAF